MNLKNIIRAHHGCSLGTGLSVSKLNFPIGVIPSHTFSAGAKKLSYKQSKMKSEEERYYNKESHMAAYNIRSKTYL